MDYEVRELKRKFEAMNETILTDILPPIQQHERDLHGSENGLMRRMKAVEKLVWMASGILGFLNLLVIILTLFKLLKYGS